MTDTTEPTTLDPNEQIAVRRQKLAELRAQGSAYPNDFRRQNLAAEVISAFGEQDADSLQADEQAVVLAGRIMQRRKMGKASFIHIQDQSGKIQVYLRRDDLPEGVYEQFKGWDIGDIVGVEGVVFKTKTGELSVRANAIRLLCKSLRPLPDKYHGLADQEMRYRQRYVDLIVNEKARDIFKLRSKTVSFIRHYLTQIGFLEVETPMMHSIPGGASARPFVTHHNALDMELFLRIAPELYLKRLVVGGFEKVFEINRNFRNEGLSVRHNPEFTMLEFYQAYTDYKALMDLTEDLMRQLAQHLFGQQTVSYQGELFDLSKPFPRYSVVEAILRYNPELTDSILHDEAALRCVAQEMGIQLSEDAGLGKIQIEIFEKTVESRLQQPTFITEYPTEVSPLARCSDSNPFVTDRFEFFIAGREVANGFSELNDPDDQAERFRAQVQAKNLGDQEAMHYDEDYITALEVGLPPTAGEGIGIDRLVMFLADVTAIKEVILFPQLRRQS